ncbi:N-acetylmuramoyl-L-alanine amidase AmiD [uncultured Alphaproteobacteria bacterium]|uniref:N-acetylmuramoyl-L-alanine amidase n=1 Tax=uncultured Alphaproteobacteria bacterium TaxID=91750 RepID=A0A212JK49_9PROT|nr:N-acetylmuramoyl-L-alanine amidase AmiD [uncultured Alphaproteobacteria bacterium]
MPDALSPNCEPRPEGAAIDMLVLHYTGMETAEAARARLLDPAAKVSAHYLIDEDGRIAELVPEALRAWHAGVSFWRGATGVNDRSIGIELVNPGHDWGYRDFPLRQVDALADLCRAILARHPIPARNVVGHSDVAPRRKRDPGELFPWRRLAAVGVGLWPAPAEVPHWGMAATLAALGRYGYDVADPHAALAAFQRHFRPKRVDGLPDRETAEILAGLLKAAGDAPA